MQAIADGASLITFSGDKLLGGPQAGIIAGRRDLVEACKRHPLARALRPGGLVLESLQATALAYLDRRAATDIPFWRMVAAGTGELRRRADAVLADVGTVGGRHDLRVEESEAVPGAGSAPGVVMPSIAVSLAGDHLDALRAHPVPVVARTRDGRTVLDLRSVHHDDDVVLAEALRGLP